MARYNRPVAAAPVPVKAAKPAKGVIGTKRSGVTAVTGEGHLGHERKDKSALFLLAAASLGGEDRFYESGQASTQRLVELVRRIAVKDPEWTALFLKWLRSEGNIRTASVVGAVEAADALAKAGIPGGRQIVASVLQRADEPGEAMAYWLATHRGPKGERVIMPISIKRALADAVGRLYSEFSLLKYDSGRAAVRFGDVIEMVHPEPKHGFSVVKTISDLASERGVDLDEVEAALRGVASEVRESAKDKDDDVYLRLGTADFVRKPLPSLGRGWRTKVAARVLGMTPTALIEALRPVDAPLSWQSDLFRYAIERRHGRGTEPAQSLGMIRAQQELRRRFEETPEIVLEEESLKAAGMTWEDALSLAGQAKLDKAKVWKAILPSLGYMALIRNLRNLDEAKVSDKDVAAAIARIQDPEQVAKSRQLPYRFYSAFKSAPSLRWGHALDVALNLSLKNIPALGGRTLILIDTSGSMSATMSGKSTMRYDEVAALFGLALGLKGEADVWAWATGAYQFPVKGTSVLRNLEQFMRENNKVGSGTDLEQAIRKSYVPGKYARMVVISDMQVLPYGRGLIPTDIPCYFYNLAGYRASAVETTGRVYELGGLTDHTFGMIKMLEAGESGRWPWE